jgi:pyruvate dehydrogenase E2 component (dihydrolipoamide acetyltransferase)
MAQDVTLGMDGMLLNWLKDVGESVNKGDIIAEFEADKATVEVEAPDGGVITEHLLDIGEEAVEGDIIARIGSADEAGDDDTAPASPEPATSDDSAPAPASANGNTASTSSNGAAARTPDGRIKASPLAKKVAADKGVDLAQVTGSGPGGRIVKADVETFDPAQAPPAAPDTKPTQGATAQPVSDGVPTSLQSYGKLPDGDHVEIEDISRMRRAIANGTIKSWTTTPHFFVTIEIAMDEFLSLRKQLNADLEQEGIKLSVNDLIVKAVALALKKFPNLNSHYYGEKIVRHQQVNVAIAVALPDNGLVNVVSPAADTTSLSAMASYHKQMFNDVREGKIKPEYTRNGTFLVSNLGAYGVDEFSSIIDAPQAAALAVGASKRVPVVLDDGTLGVGTRMKTTLSIDHRVSDGAEGAQFLAYLKEIIENPMRLLV